MLRAGAASPGGVGAGRRFAFTADAEALVGDGDVPDELADGRGAITLELFDFGADVAIEVPADEDIFAPTQPTSAPGAKG